jgi:hypothetical protein
MADDEGAVIPPVELRARAARCFALAAALPPGEAAETLIVFGREYVEMAERLEGLAIITTGASDAGAERS